MRTRLVTAAVLVFAFASAVPPARAQGVGSGIKGGPTFSTFSQAGTDFGNNTGFLAGAFFGGNRHGGWGIMWEGLYGKKGAVRNSVQTDFQFIEIPVLLRINSTPDHKYIFSPYAIVGPVWDVILTARQDDVDVMDDFRRIDLGIIAGGGVEIHRFIVEARYNWGLRNVSALPGGTAEKIRTRSLAVMAGYRLTY